MFRKYFQCNLCRITIPVCMYVKKGHMTQNDIFWQNPEKQRLFSYVDEKLQKITKHFFCLF